MRGAAKILGERLRYRFSDEALLGRALTHRSASNQHNARLEFLGDAVLGFVIGEELYHRFPGAGEGELTRLRASLVRKEALAALAREIELSEFIILGEGELKSGGWRRGSILANALEAIIGAVYIDGGFASGRECILALFGPLLQQISPDNVSKDPKTELQEYLQARRLPLPAYEVVSTEGDPHQQMFTVRCSVPLVSGPVEATGSSRRKAEQAAAEKALAQIKADER